MDVMPGDPGWLEAHFYGEDDPRVLVKFERRGDRNEVTKLVIVGEVSSSTLRAIPIGRIEAWLNAREPDGRLAWAYDDAPWEWIEELAQEGVVFPGDLARADEALDSYLERSADSVTRKTIREVGREREGVVRSSSRRKLLTRPDGTDPVGFSRRVAEAYNEAIRQTPAPATILAAEAGVPVTTVHRWIREARQRGFLPPARKGRAG